MSIAAHRFNNNLRYRDGNHPNQTQLTPEYVLEPVRRAMGGVIDLDPCTTVDNPVGATCWFTVDHDGLAQSWGPELEPRIFCNPPYGKAREAWVDRCIEVGELGASVILLIPSHTDTRTFQRAAISARAVVFVRGRLKFGVLRPNRRQVASSHPSALLCWNVRLDPLRHLGITAMFS